MQEQAVTVLKGTNKAPRALQPDADVRSSPAPAPTAPRPHLVLPALASAGLLYLCFFPVAWGWLAWVALVPLLCLVRAETTGKRLFKAAWLGGLVFFWAVLQWMRYADHRMYYTWAMLATYCSLYFPVAILLVRRLDRHTRLPLVVVFPAVWVGLEFVRSYLLTGFAWYYLGHTQHDYLALIQVSDLGGAYLVSILVAAVNAWVFEALYAWPQFRAALNLPGKGVPAVPASVRRLVVEGAVVAVLLGAALGYGVYRLNEDAFTPGPRLALLQGNLDQRIRNAASSGTADAQPAQEAMFNHFFNLFGYAVDGRISPVLPDLVVWPETSFPENRMEIADGLPLDDVPEKVRDATRRNHQLFQYFGEKCKVDTLLGLNTFVVADGKGKEIRYNSALLLRGTGATGGRYDKIHRVPFGEYVPFRDWLPFMDAFAPYEGDYSVRAGERMPRLSLGKYRFGVVICYEDTDPFLARVYGRPTEDGPPADFLVNISNDGWFDGSSEHDEHLAISRFRAVETRRSMARSVNMGISAVIDGNGRVLAPTHVAVIDREGQMLRTSGPLSVRGGLEWVRLPGLTDRVVTEWSRFGNVHKDVTREAPNANFIWMKLAASKEPADLAVADWHRFKQVQGVLTQAIPLDGRTSLYSLWGDWLAGVCWLLILGGLVWASWAGRRTAVAGSAAA